MESLSTLANETINMKQSYLEFDLIDGSESLLDFDHFSENYLSLDNNHRTLSLPEAILYTGIVSASMPAVLELIKRLISKTKKFELTLYHAENSLEINVEGKYDLEKISELINDYMNIIEK